MPRVLTEHFDVKTLRRRLDEMMRQRDTNPGAVSKAARLGSTAVYDIVTGRNNNPGIPILQAIAKVLAVDLGYLIGEQKYPTLDPEERATDRIPIAGIAETGAFRQMIDFGADYERELPILRAPRSRLHPRARHFALEVRGDSMNAARPAPIVEGMYVLCVDIVSAELLVESGRIYAVRQTRDAGQTWECTIKRAKVYRDRVELVPESTNANHQKIVIERDLDPAHTNEVAAIGLVYGLYSSFEGP